MQTFLPYRDFARSIATLDNQRLNAQRREAMQIFLSLVGRRLGLRYGYVYHPATLQWEGYAHALLDYCNACIREWRKRGYRNTISVRKARKVANILWKSRAVPKWLGWKEFHQSHRGRLLQKDEQHYRTYFPKDEPRDYVWPSRYPRYQKHILTASFSGKATKDELLDPEFVQSRLKC